MKHLRPDFILWGLVFCLLLQALPSGAQPSVARQWNEALLHAIRNDFARPTVHARNLWHTSIALYDSWAVFESDAETFLLGNTVGDFFCPFEGFTGSETNVQTQQEEAMSYAAYRLLTHRFKESPNATESLQYFDSLLVQLGYDSMNVSVDYTTGAPAALGNYLADQLIEFGLQDGAKEEFGYINFYYRPSNFAFDPRQPGVGTLNFPNLWQPLAFDVFIDQSGQVIPTDVPAFLSPEWGEVVPFALSEEDLTIYERQGINYRVYHDPGAPSLLDIRANSDPYKWGFSLVALWSAQLDPSDGVNIDISPASLGNLPVEAFPETFEEYQAFYDATLGGDPSMGHPLNPATGMPYEPQIVPRGDYARVLAEFWADGPDSETPPGHWFTILNYVNDHPQVVKRWRGQGPELSDLEWDVKTYFALGGAMHDAAVTAWGIKGWYDYIRPISAIRYMATRGQSTDENLPSFDPVGIPLVEGFVELVTAEDPLAGANQEHVGKIKLYTWLGPEFIQDPETDVAGVGWILGENWWPYQRPSFITPPFAGYVSGHSTFSRAAAEVLTYVTGDPFFPGGMGEFEVKRNEFLVFEEGPSVDFTLQWATYRDASDQTSLSRIWGGIHPPIDDIPGRRIGIEVGLDAVTKAESYFESSVVATEEVTAGKGILLYPSPITQGQRLALESDVPIEELLLIDANGRVALRRQFARGRTQLAIQLPQVSAGFYWVKAVGPKGSQTARLMVTGK